MILADTVQSLVRGAAAAAAAPSLASVTRTQALLGITTTALLPLCLVKNLSGLAPFSLVGVVGMIYTAIAMVVRYVGKSYALPIVVAAAATKSKGGATAAAVAGSGKYLSDISSAFRPKFGNLGARGALSPNVFILICLLSTAYSKLKNMICHMHTFEYFFPNHPQPVRLGRLFVYISFFSLHTCESGSF